MTSQRLLLLALLVPLAAAAPAGTVYKWIEPDGSITFSSTPPPEGEAVEEVEELPVAQPPSDADRQEADRRVKAMRELAAEMERDRKARAEGARAARVIPQPPPPTPAAPASPPPNPLGEKLVFDDWWTGPARLGEPPPAAPAPQESTKPFFTPGPVPAFH
jgi:hypothetical protein